MYVYVGVKEAEYPRLRNGKYAGPNTRIPRLVRGRYAALRLASEARTRRLAEYAAAYSDSAPSTRIPRPRTRTRLASEYAARGFSASLPPDAAYQPPRTKKRQKNLGRTN